MSNELLTSLLRDVSRSFYLTMRALPGSVRPQVSLAYLLARTADTIADTELVDPPSRLNALTALRDRILGTSAAPLPLAQLQSSQALPAERILLERSEDSLKLLNKQDQTDRQLIRQVLDIIISGQELDLKRFGSATVNQIIALQTEEDLHDYTYRVAGCVGEFWTRMCIRHLWNAGPQEKELLTKGIRFGQGLQMVNILRDLPRDLRKGRCYIPAPILAKSGLTPAELLAAETEPRFRPAYNQLVSIAEDHLAAGWEYIGLLPRGQVRLRVATSWPILIGVRTLAQLRQENMLDGTRRIKVSRPESRALILRSIVLYPFPRAWTALFAKARAATGTCDRLFTHHPRG